MRRKLAKAVWKTEFLFRSWSKNKTK